MRYQCCDKGYEREEYCSKHSLEVSNVLKGIEKDTNQMLEMGNMVSGALPGQFMQFLLGVSGARRVLEIGSYTGYSAVAFAEFLAPFEDAKLVCVDDFSDEANAEALFDKAAEYIESMRPGMLLVHKRSGKEALEMMENREVFDFVFIDADKESQVFYFDKLFSTGMLRIGGIMVVDNTLWYSRVLSETSEMDPTTKAIDAFNKYVHADERCSQVQIPIRDGMTVIQRLA